MHIGPPEHLNSDRQNIKGHLADTKRAVLLALDTYRQAWSLSDSTLPIDRDRYLQGIITTPTAADIEASRGAESGLSGHAVLLLGWDDALEFQRLDAQGEPLVDESGAPVMDRGFFLVKNSWGTSQFGSRHRVAKGYGWIAYEYVESYGRVSSAMLEGPAPFEICGDGIDNDGDGAADCEADACWWKPACVGGQPIVTAEQKTFDAATPIPDGDVVGVSADLTVDNPSDIKSLAVELHIEHPYLDDLRIALQRVDDTSPDRGVLLREPDRDTDEGGRFTPRYAISAFNGEPAAGTWRLRVQDLHGGDAGQLVGWTLHVTREIADPTREHVGPAPVEITYESTVFADLTLADGDAFGDLSVSVELDEPGLLEDDWRLVLQRVDPAADPYALEAVLDEFVLYDIAIHESEEVPVPNAVETSVWAGVRVPLDALEGEPTAGTWRLMAQGNEVWSSGAVTRWAMRFDPRPEIPSRTWSADAAQTLVAGGETLAKLTVDAAGTIEDLTARVWIDHVQPGDLTLELRRLDAAGQVVATAPLRAADPDAGYRNWYFERFDIDAFDGDDAAGDWILAIRDTTGSEPGTLVEWTLTVVGRAAPAPAPSPIVLTDSTEAEIPDGDRAGLVRVIEVDDSRFVDGVHVDVEIVHEAAADLELRLRRPGVGEVVLKPAGGTADNDGWTAHFETDSCDGQAAAGEWYLVIIDADGETGWGWLESWSLTLR